LEELVNMAAASVINLSKLEGAKRIDAEYYDPIYLDVFSKLRWSPNFGQLVKRGFCS